MMTETVGAILVRDGQVLLGLRASHKTFAGDWDIIGGHMREGEAAWPALCRELMEEIGVEDPTGVRLRTLTVGDPPYAEVLHVYLISSWQGEPCVRNDEHSEVRWFDPDTAASLPNLAAPGYRALFDAVGRRTARRTP